MLEEIKVPIIKLPVANGLDLPDYATPFSAGMDLLAAINVKLKIDPGQRAIINTGICIGLPLGFEAQVRSRSGLAAKNGIFVLNSPGTIDADYRGEIMVILQNLGDKMFMISRGMKIAQLVVAPVVKVAWENVNQLTDSVRGEGGLGSTGV